MSDPKPMSFTCAHECAKRGIKVSPVKAPQVYLVYERGILCHNLNGKLEPVTPEALNLYAKAEFYLQGIKVQPKEQPISAEHWIRFYEEMAAKNKATDSQYATAAEKPSLHEWASGWLGNGVSP